VERRAHAASAGYTARLQRSDNASLSDALGPDSVVGLRRNHRRSDDQRSIRAAASKPSFREPLRKQRCLVPSDGFYEWKRSGKQKQPFCFEVVDGAVFAFAGLWDCWQSADGEAIETCTILTTTPNELLADVHDRMPVILAADQYDRWLDPFMQDAATAMGLFKPFGANLMRRYPVSTRVNLVANDDPECSAPIDLPAVPATLFD
jgi:putative SOS response-associated peptidase YedK